jgi:hypothetical protein
MQRDEACGFIKFYNVHDGTVGSLVDCIIYRCIHQASSFGSYDL